MLTVTERAKSKLREYLVQQAREIVVRVIPSEGNVLDLKPDEERKGDEVIKDDDGRTLLVVEPDVALELEGGVLDYKSTPQGEMFAVTLPPFSKFRGQALDSG